MKKITFLFALACSALFSTTANAEVGDVVTDLANLSSSKAYVLTTERGSMQANDTKVVRSASSDTSDETLQFALVKPSDTATDYYIFSVSQKRFLGVDNTWNSAFASNGTFTIQSDGVSGKPFRFKASNGNYINFDGSRTFVINWWSSSDDGNSFTFTEAGDLSSDVQAAIKNMLNLYSDSELQSLTSTVTRAITAYSNASSEEECYTTFKTTYDAELEKAEADPASWTKDALSAAYNTFLAGRSSFLTDNQKVIIGNKLHTTRYAYVNRSNPQNKGVNPCIGAGESFNTPSYLWTIKKQADGTVKLYNEYDNLWVGSLPTSNNMPFAMVDEASSAAFTAIKRGDGYVNFVDLTYSDVSKAALHMVDWDAVVRWGVSAEASCFTLAEPTADNLNSWTSSLMTTKSIGTNVGDLVSSDELTAAQSALSAATVDNYVTAYKAMEAALKSATTIAPVEGTYYTIEVARRAEHLGQKLVESYDANSDTDNNYALQHVANPTNLVPALWQFEPAANDGEYYLKAANSGLYLSKTDGISYHLRLLASDNADKGTYSIGKNSVDVAHAVSLKDVNATSNSLISTRTENDDVVAWDGSNDGSGNNFYIQAVTSLPVTISAAGYATLNLPFAVTIPDGVKAYKGVQNGDEITLTEIAGVIPAQQPVILVGAEGSHNFNLTTANATAEAGSLTGTLTPATIDSETTAYILKNGDHGVGMYILNSESDRTIGANKAYVIAKSASANVLAFNFGNVTGINNAAVAGKANTYYDLNGRRVLYPAHGVFVKGNGQKVYIK